MDIFLTLHACTLSKVCTSAQLFKSVRLPEVFILSWMMDRGTLFFFKNTTVLLLKTVILQYASPSVKTY